VIRFIIKRRFADSYSGASSETLETILLDVPELQAALKRGGHGPMGYDISELMGVELVEEQTP
jgi:hypothetical protein